jgi:hypothetical protein
MKANMNIEILNELEITFFKQQHLEHALVTTTQIAILYSLASTPPHGDLWKSSYRSIAQRN